MSHTEYPKWFKREIEIWERNGDNLAYAIPLPDIQLAVLQKYYGAEDDDPVIDMYVIEEDDVDFYNYFITLNFDFEKYEYWLHTYTTDISAAKIDGGFMGLFPPPKSLPGFPDAKRLKPSL
jgi:hypothetical protein